MSSPGGLPPGQSLFGREVRRIHALGVGGMGVAPLASFLVHRGFSVTGEDDALSGEVGALLAAEGVVVGPLPADCDLVVRSSAVPEAHPACRAAAARGIPVVRRGELLAEVARGLRLVAVCGSHGKTTTTAMLATALARAGCPAGWIIGGLPADGSAAARAGAGDWLVAEIDESDGTIDRFQPEIAVVVNLDWDHADRYETPADLEAAFASLFQRTRGTVLVNAACAISRRLAPRAPTFGPDGDFRGRMARESADGFVLALGGRFSPAEAPVRAHGDFNALNATAALAAVALILEADGQPGQRIPKADLLADYAGVRRRQGVLASAGGITVIEDYAHHPAEIRALLPALRARIPAGGRLITVFQSHRYSRTAQFRRDFALALALSDRVHLLETYGAGEGPLPGGSASDLHAEMGAAVPGVPVVCHLGERAGLLDALSREARSGDLVAFVGAGDLDRDARHWARDLARKARPGAETPRPRDAGTWDRFVAKVGPALSPASRLVREEDLAKRTTLRVGGAARLYAEPGSVDDLRRLLAAAVKDGIRILALGRGSNLIVPDGGVDALVVALTGEAWSGFEQLADGCVRVGAGMRLKALCGRAAADGLAGFEFLEGIPGCLGGALRMNAGAMGGWTFDVVREMTLMTLAGEIVVLPRARIRADYRRCSDLDEAVALSAVLRPSGRALSAAVAGTIDAYRRKRHDTQPREPSAGCMFKNPPNTSAGRLIDEAGLKGERVGDAQVSPVHANFIVNLGGASGADVIELIRRVRARVRETAGVELEPEAILFGWDWRDVL